MGFLKKGGVKGTQASKKNKVLLNDDFDYESDNEQTVKKTPKTPHAKTLKGRQPQSDEKISFQIPGKNTLVKTSKNRNSRVGKEQTPAKILLKEFGGVRTKVQKKGKQKRQRLDQDDDDDEKDMDILDMLVGGDDDDDEEEEEDQDTSKLPVKQSGIKISTVHKNRTPVKTARMSFSKKDYESDNDQTVKKTPKSSHAKTLKGKQPQSDKKISFQTPGKNTLVKTSKTENSLVGKKQTPAKRSLKEFEGVRTKVEKNGKQKRQRLDQDDDDEEEEEDIDILDMLVGGDGDDDEEEEVQDDHEEEEEDTSKLPVKQSDIKTSTLQKNRIPVKTARKSFSKKDYGSDSDQIVKNTHKAPDAKTLKGKQPQSDKKISFQAPGQNTLVKTPKNENFLVGKKQTPAKMSLKEFEGVQTKVEKNGKQKRQRIDQDEDIEKDMDALDMLVGGDDDDDEEEEEEIDEDDMLMGGDDEDVVDDDDNNVDDVDSKLPVKQSDIKTSTLQKNRTPVKNAKKSFRKKEQKRQSSDQADDDDDEEEEEDAVDIDEDDVLLSGDKDDVDDDNDDTSKLPAMQSDIQTSTLQKNRTPVNGAERSLSKKDERDRKTLCVRKLPEDITLPELKALSTDIVHVNINQKRKNMFAYLEFHSEQKAEKNYSYLQKMKLRNIPVSVEYIGQETKTNGETLEMRQLFIGNLPKYITAEEIKTLSTDIIDIKIKRRLHHTFAFLEFNSEEKAEENYNSLQKKKLRNVPVSVHYTQEICKYTPSRDKDLYIGNLPKDITDTELRALSSDIININIKQGPDFTFAFLEFNSKEKAEENFNYLQKKKLRNVSVSVGYTGEKSKFGASADRVLHIGNLPKDITDTELKALSTDIINVIIKQKWNDTFAFLEFNSEEKADKNYNYLQKKKLRNVPVSVNYTGEKSKNRADRELFIGNLPKDITDTELKALSTDIINIIIKQRWNNVFAFLEFNSEEKAEENFNSLQKKKLRNNFLLVRYKGEEGKNNRNIEDADKKEINVKKLHVPTLPLDSTIAHIAGFFPKASDIIINQSSSSKSAIIHYLSEESAAADLEECKSAVLDGKSLEVLYFRSSVPAPKSEKRNYPFSLHPNRFGKRKNSETNQNAKRIKLQKKESDEEE